MPFAISELIAIENCTYDEDTTTYIDNDSLIISEHSNDVIPSYDNIDTPLNDDDDVELIFDDDDTASLDEDDDVELIFDDDDATITTPLNDDDDVELIFDDDDATITAPVTVPLNDDNDATHNDDELASAEEECAFYDMGDSLFDDDSASLNDDDDTTPLNDDDYTTLNDDDDASLNDDELASDEEEPTLDDDYTTLNDDDDASLNDDELASDEEEPTLDDNDATPLNDDATHDNDEDDAQLNDDDVDAIELVDEPLNNTTHSEEVVEPIDEHAKLMIEDVNAVNFIDEPVNKHAKLMIEDVNAVDFVDEPVNEHAKLTIVNVDAIDFVDESVEYCTIDVKPCEVTYDSNGNIIDIEVCDYEVEDDCFDEVGQDDDDNVVKFELHKVVRETGDVIDVKLYAESKYEPDLEIETIDIAAVETYQYDDDNKHAITFIEKGGSLKLYRRNYIMPPYDIIDFDSDDDQKLILVDDYEATTTNDEVVKHVTDLTNAVIEYTSFTFTATSTIINTLQMINDDHFIDSLMNINAGYTSKTAERIRYEENVHDTTKYHDEMKRMMTAVKKHDTFEVDINDDSEKQYAFTQVLRYIRKNKSTMPKPVVLGYTLDGDSKAFPLNNELAIDEAINAILGEVTVESFGSDTNPGLIGLDYIPIRFVVKFITSTKHDGKTTFYEKINDEYDELLTVDAFRDSHDGAFFPYVNLIPSLDLTRYQIYHEVDAKNYTDNCFVYACIQSGVFTDDEIDKLRGMMRTRSIPNKKILQIAINMQCHFVVYRIDESRDVKHQKHSSVDTRKNSKVVADRMVKLLLYKDHFMIDNNETLPITTYYIEHRHELDEKHADIPVEKRFRIRGCLLYTSPSPRDPKTSRMPSSA